MNQPSNPWNPPVSHQGGQPNQFQGGYQPQGPGRPLGGHPQSQPSPAKPPSRAPRILIIIGATMLGLGALLAALFIVQVTSLTPSEQEIIPVKGTRDISISGGEMKVIYASSPQVRCRVVGPGSTRADVNYRTEMSFTHDGTSYTSIGKIGGRGEPDGVYTVECDGSGVIVAPPLNVAGIIGAIVAGLFGFSLMGLGLILLVVGLVLRARRRRSA